MQILPNIEIIDLCLYLQREKTLIIPDLHIGYEEALNKQGVLVPRFQFKDTVEKLKKILDSVKIEKIVLIGDVKHEFGTISETEWKQTLAVLDLLESYTKEIVLIKGNHDTILGPIAKRKGLNIVGYVIVGDVMLLHGDKIIENPDFKKAKILIIGHEHPAITLREKAKRETFKCFLLGNYKRKKLVVMPSFNPIISGTNILKERPLSPYLSDIDGFEVFVAENSKVFYFGKAKNLR